MQGYNHSRNRDEVVQSLPHRESRGLSQLHHTPRPGCLGGDLNAYGALPSHLRGDMIFQTGRDI